MEVTDGSHGHDGADTRPHSSSLPALPADYSRLREYWMWYVCEEISILRLPEMVERNFCQCSKSRTSYPHWPPTSYREADDQLRCLIGLSYSHRMYLADCWLSFLHRNMVSQELVALVDESIVRYGWSCSDNSLQNSNSLHMESVDLCEEICYPVLNAKSCFCLCCCRIHRDECPPHRI
jgi:hypothetical protein